MNHTKRSGYFAYALALLAVIVVQILIGLHGQTLTSWSHEFDTLLLASGLSAAVGIAFAVLLIREFRRRDSIVTALASSEDRFRDFARTASDWLWETDAQHRLIWFSEENQAYDIKMAQSMIGKTRWENERREPNQAKWAAHQDDLDQRRPFKNFEFWILDFDGRKQHIRVSGVPFFDSKGEFRGYRGTALDITAEVEARADAERANVRLLDAIESLSEGFALFDADDKLVICNRAFGEYHKDPTLGQPGRSFGDIMETLARDLVHPSIVGGDHDAWMRWRLEQHRHPGRPIEIKYRNNHWARVVENRTRDGGIVFIRTDITEIKNREAELKSRVAQQNSVALLGQLALEPVQLDRLLMKATDLITRTLGVPLSSILELTSDSREFVLRATSGWPRGYVGHLRLPVDERFQAGYTLKVRMPVVSPDLASETRFKIHPMILSRGVVSALTMTIEGGGQPFGVLTCFADRHGVFSGIEINFVQAVANVLANTVQRHQQEARLRAILDNSVDSIISIDEHGRIESANQAVERMFGYSEGELVGHNITLLMPERYRAAHERQMRLHLDTAESQLTGKVREFEGLRRDGTEFPIDIGIRELKLGSRRLFIGSIRDASTRKVTEEHLRHAQKMEAIGQLTGGLAHDFNNLLTIIQGNAEMLQDALASEHAALRTMADTVVNASSRGALLTQRLLAFARKQALEAAAFNMNDLVLKTEDLLRRTLGAHIKIEHRLAADLPLVFADPSQVEMALVNLAINGRDAMPNGGVIKIETARAHLDNAYAAAHEVGAGEYVMLAVTDSGVGMPPEIVSRVFEPFFTTKEVGKGTGLGLSMVYGFVKQSGGHVRIYSEPGHGTTVRLYLPPPAGNADATELHEPRASLPSGHETILVVEDDAEVRRLTTTRLESLGYQVIECPDGPSALAVLDAGRKIDLLFTDVVMPGGMNGRELAEQAKRRRPALKVLLTSGYAEAALSDRMAGDTAFTILTKPYGKPSLAEKIRAALG